MFGLFKQLKPNSKKFSKTMAKYRIVMLRHGTSGFNDANLFTGWIDSDLSDKGVKQAENAAKLLKDGNYKFDMAYTSCLKRAQRTCNIILKYLGQEHIPVHKSWKLNERHYGALTGMNRAVVSTEPALHQLVLKLENTLENKEVAMRAFLDIEWAFSNTSFRSVLAAVRERGIEETYCRLDMVEKYGIEQVKIWRRSYDIPPPTIEEDHPYYNEIINNESFKDIPSKEDFPKAESLKMACERIIPYWNNIANEIRKGNQCLLVLHGTTCRAILKHVCKISDEDIRNVNVPTAIPFQIDLNEDMAAASDVKYLGDEETVKRAIQEVEDQIKKKPE